MKVNLNVTVKVTCKVTDYHGHTSAMPNSHILEPSDYRTFELLNLRTTDTSLYEYFWYLQLYLSTSTLEIWKNVGYLSTRE